MGEMARQEGLTENLVALYDDLRNIIASDDFRNGMKALLSGFVALLRIMGLVARVLLKVLSLVQQTVDKMGGWERVTKLLGSAIAALAILRLASLIAGLITTVTQMGLVVTAMKAAKLASIGLSKAMMMIPHVALAIGLTLLLEDLWNFAEGNESVTGKIIKDWKGVDSALKSLFTGWIETLEGRWNMLIDLANKIPGVDIGHISMDTKNMGTNYLKLEDRLSNALGAMTMQYGPSPAGDRTSNNNFAPTVNITVPPGNDKGLLDTIGKTVETKLGKIYRDVMDAYPEIE